MERIDGAFIRGFTAGLQEARSIVSYIYSDMRHHKRRMTSQELQKVFSCALDNREALRDNPDVFIRCAQGGGYEAFDAKKQEVVDNGYYTKAGS